MYNTFSCVLVLSCLSSFGLSRAGCAQTVEQLPAAPADLARKIEQCSVSFSFYDAKPSDQKYTGQTNFKIYVDYRYRTQMRSVRRARSVHYRIALSYTKIAVTPSNVISLPRSLLTENFWSEQLVLHEFDHVRVNCDPRIALLTRHLIRGVNRLDIVTELDEALSRERIAEEIDARIRRVTAEVTDLVQKNNDLLDTVTRHGVTSDADDPFFFQRLYTESNLKDQGFTSLTQVKSLLESATYAAYSRSDTAQ